RIFRQSVDPGMGFQGWQGRKIAAALGVRGELMTPAVRLLDGVSKRWRGGRASLVEINPLCIIAGRDGKPCLAAVDAKMSLDDNALFRHPALMAIRDLGEEAPLEIEASKYS